MRILILCNKSPYPAKEGGPMAINMIVEGLLKAGHSVKILAMNTNKYRVEVKDIPDEYRQKTSIELISVDLRVKPLQAFLNLFTKRSYHVDRFISYDYANRLKEILVQEQFDVVQFEMPYLSPYLALVKKYSNAKTILRAHNIEHKIWERIAQTTSNSLKKLYLNHLAKTLKTHELEVMSQFDGVATISSIDETIFRKLVPNIKAVTTIPFGIDLAKYNWNPIFSEPISLCSIGAMNWIPNAEGIHWFLENVWPHVNARFPSLKYHIAGREMPEWMKNTNISNVVIEGEVEDAQQFIQKHPIMIVPLFSGSGIRIKIIEGMACGKVIISTPVGAEGVQYENNKDILIASTSEDFFKCISSLVVDTSLIQKIGKQARTLIENEYNRDIIIENLLRFYQKTP